MRARRTGSKRWKRWRCLTTYSLIYSHRRRLPNGRRRTASVLLNNHLPFRRLLRSLQQDEKCQKNSLASHFCVTVPFRRVISCRVTIKKRAPGVGPLIKRSSYLHFVEFLKSSSCEHQPAVLQAWAAYQASSQQKTRADGIFIREETGFVGIGIVLRHLSTDSAITYASLP